MWSILNTLRVLFRTRPAEMCRNIYDIRFPYHSIVPRNEIQILSQHSFPNHAEYSGHSIQRQ
jgi:hypothetical protein